MILNGDCREVLIQYQDNTFDSCVSDPPYEIGILGKAWDSTGVAYDQRLWQQVYRVLKPGAYLVVFSSPRTYHRVACAIEDAGFNIRDQITWLKGGASMPKGGRLSPAIDKKLGATRKVVGSRKLSGTAALSLAEKGGTYSVGVSSHGRSVQVDITESSSDAAKVWEGWAHNLKPVIEPICLAQKPVEGSAVANVLQWGVGGLNVDGCAVPVAGSDTITRWPPNAVITHAEDCDDDRCVMWCPAAEIARQSGETKSAGNKQPSSGTGAFFGSATGRHTFDVSTLAKGDTGAADRYFPRFFWHGRCSNREKTLDGLVECVVPTVKPWNLIKYLVKLVTPPGGLNLDPFAGSGQGQIACDMLGVEHVGIELDQKHFECATARSNAMRLGCLP